jgi:transposase-like protein
MAKRVYTAEDQALVRQLLEAHEGNVKRVSREADLPEQTVRDWKKKWEREGPSTEIVAATPAAVEKWVGNVERVRDKAVERLEKALDDPATKVNVKDLSMTVGILTDKARLGRGQVTSRPDKGQDALPIEQARELFAGMARGMLEAAQQRHETISSHIDGEVIEDGEYEQVVPAAALESSTSE